MIRRPNVQLLVDSPAAESDVHTYCAADQFQNPQSSYHCPSLTITRLSYQRLDRASLVDRMQNVGGDERDCMTNFQKTKLMENIRQDANGLNTEAIVRSSSQGRMQAKGGGGECGPARQHIREQPSGLGSAKRTIETHNIKLINISGTLDTGREASSPCYSTLDGRRQWMWKRQVLDIP